MPTVIVHLSNTTSVECEVSSIVTVSLLAAPVVFVMCCCVFAWCGRDTTEQIFCCFSSACFDCLQKVFGGFSRCGANLRARLTLFEFRSGSVGTTTTTTIELSPVCKFPDPIKFNSRWCVLHLPERIRGNGVAGRPAGLWPHFSPALPVRMDDSVAFVSVVPRSS